MKVLFVCTGNTCRSPMAEAVFRHLAARADLPHTAASAGLTAFEGASATEEAVRAVREISGADLSAHRAHRVTAEDMEDAGLIVAMTADHRRSLLLRFPTAAVRVRTLWPDRDVKDPYGGDDATYDAAAREIAEGVGALLAELERGDGHPSGEAVESC